MTPHVLVVLACVLLVVPLSARDLSSGDFTIVGDYIEARTSDVYVGPCFANSEMNLTGQEAVLAWRVREDTAPPR